MMDEEKNLNNELKKVMENVLFMVLSEMNNTI